MALLKKVSPEWNPSENPGLQVGETIDFPAPYETLVKSGMAVLVDAEGNELELPNQVIKCPICFSEISGLLNFVDHVSTHGKKNTVVKEAEKIVEKVVEKVEEVEKTIETKLDKKEAKK